MSDLENFTKIETAFLLYKNHTKGRPIFFNQTLTFLHGIVAPQDRYVVYETIQKTKWYKTREGTNNARTNCVFNNHIINILHKFNHKTSIDLDHGMIFIRDLLTLTDKFLGKEEKDILQDCLVGAGCKFPHWSPEAKKRVAHKKLTKNLELIKSSGEARISLLKSLLESEDSNTN